MLFSFRDAHVIHLMTNKGCCEMLKEILFLPHGVQIIPDVERPYNKDFSRLHQTMSRVSQEVIKESPTTVVVITPHGIATDNQFGIYHNRQLAGRIAFDVHEHPENFIFENDLTLASTIHKKAKKEGYPITRIVAGVAAENGFLQWGELVPLYYTAWSLNPRPQVVVISIPLQRYEDLDSMTHLLLSFGEFLEGVLDEMEQDILLVGSGDLSHCHDPQGPYGYHETARTFDECILQWLSGEDDDLLVKKALSLDKTAKSCGLATLFLLQGVFKVHPPSSRKVLAYDVPSYFGMAVALFSLTSS